MPSIYCPFCFWLINFDSRLCTIINITCIIDLWKLKRELKQKDVWTWPKCLVGKQIALEEFQSKFDVQEYVIYEEEHKDGDLHLHAFIYKFSKQILFMFSNKNPFFN